MVFYRRKRMSKRSYSKRKSSFKRRSSRRSSKRVSFKRMLSAVAEKKFTYLENTAIMASCYTSSPRSYLIVPPVQGTTDNTRIGDKIRLHNFKANLQIYTTGASNQADNITVRIELILVKNPHGSTPSNTDVYNSSTPLPQTLHNDITRNFSSRFKTLWSRSWTFQPQYYYTSDGHTITRQQSLAKLIHINVPLHEIVMDCSLGNAGTIADIDTNALYFFMHTDASNANNTVDCYSSHRLFYSDV